MTGCTQYYDQAMQAHGKKVDAAKMKMSELKVVVMFVSGHD